MKFYGIDPGIGGAVAVIDDCAGVSPQEVAVCDTPTALKPRTNGDSNTRIYDLKAMAWLFHYAKPSDCFVVIERASAMPRTAVDAHGRSIKVTMGTAGMFDYGAGYGAWLGILTAYRINYEKVSPVTWKKAFTIEKGAGKEASLDIARHLFPHVRLDLKKHHGRAEALLLARYAQMIWRPERTARHAEE